MTMRDLHFKPYRQKPTLLLVGAALLGAWGASAAWGQSSEPLAAMRLPAPTVEQRLRFNRDVRAATADVAKEDGTSRAGYVTDNRTFLREVIEPMVRPHLPALRKLPPGEIINRLALFGHDA